MAMVGPGEIGRVRRAPKAPSLERETVAESRDGLRRMVEAIRRGELNATPGLCPGSKGPSQLSKRCSRRLLSRD